jgi:AraC-like DNA-binding protein
MGDRLGTQCDGIDGAALAGEVTMVAAQPGPTPLRVSRDIGHVTPRAVQYMFRRHLDTTPLQYVRRLRRHYAHQDLLAAEGNQDTVTAIAVALGVHRSTVRYRRYRISELTRLDAADTRSVEALRDLANLHRRQYQGAGARRCQRMCQF